MVQNLQIHKAEKQLLENKINEIQQDFEMSKENLSNARHSISQLNSYINYET